MQTLFFLFTWAFWKWVFIVLGIIFLLLLLFGAFMWWAVGDFDEDKPGYNAHNLYRILPVGYPTSTKDVTGKIICLGDTVDYDFPGDAPCPFVVVFEENAFRKKYANWDNTLPKPILETAEAATYIRLKIVKS